MTMETIETIPAQPVTPRIDITRLGIGMLFLSCVLLYADSYLSVSGGTFLVIAAMVGGYMAMNIGANDVANNVGPAVGSGALTMIGAIAIAAVFEVAGALLAGGDVVSTIKKGIIDPALIADSVTFIWLMMAALVAAALWLNIATAFGAPVSTTHSIVGGVLGAGIAAGGWQIANWATMGKIAASWIISPALGGIIAALFLYLITRTITYQKDLIGAARRVVPYLVAIMVGAFVTYLAIKGLKKVWKIEFATAAMLGTVSAGIAFALARPLVARASVRLPNDRSGVDHLFTLPLIVSAALLSFAHGANDVANAVGPLAAIADALSTGDIAKKAAIPMWVMVIGAGGIAIGLALYGPKLIRTVGSEITHLDKTRAFCVALGAALTVIIASQLGLPVSSTHIAVGGIFGVGFLREYLNANVDKMNIEIEDCLCGEKPQDVKAFMSKFSTAAIAEKQEMVKNLRKNGCKKLYLAKKARKDIRKGLRNELVKRAMLVKIASAWIITVPASAAMGAAIYFTIRGFMLP